MLTTLGCHKPDARSASREPFTERRVLRDGLRQNLQSIPPWQPRMAGQVHLTHPTGAQCLDDRVTSEDVPRSQLHAGMLAMTREHQAANPGVQSEISLSSATRVSVRIGIAVDSDD